MAIIPVRNLDLVVPLANMATDMRITETSGLVAQDRSGAVSSLIGASLRRGDVDSTTRRSTLATQITPGIRISTTVTRTTITRTTSSEPEPSAEQAARHHADFSKRSAQQKYQVDLACEGCNHCHYAAPNGLKGGSNPEILRPHIRCIFFAAYIPAIVEKLTGCDGTKSPKVIRYEIPDGCPAVMQSAQMGLF